MRPLAVYSTAPANSITLRTPASVLSTSSCTDLITCVFLTPFIANSPSSPLPKTWDPLRRHPNQSSGPLVTLVIPLCRLRALRESSISAVYTTKAISATLHPWCPLSSWTTLPRRSERLLWMISSLRRRLASDRGPHTLIWLTSCLGRSTVPRN